MRYKAVIVERYADMYYKRCAHVDLVIIATTLCIGVFCADIISHVTDCKRTRVWLQLVTTRHLDIPTTYLARIRYNDSHALDLEINEVYPRFIETNPYYITISIVRLLYHIT